MPVDDVFDRQRLTAATFVELIDTLVDDFDVIDILTVLASRCVQLLDAAAAGILLADASGELRVMAGSSEEIALHIQEKPVVLSQLRSTILELLTLQSATALVTPEGKDALKAAIKTRVGKHLSKDQQVMDVLFAEFVVQF